jgi:hypothetical protein
MHGATEMISNSTLLSVPVLGRYSEGHNFQDNKLFSKTKRPEIFIGLN